MLSFSRVVLVSLGLSLFALSSPVSISIPLASATSSVSESHRDGVSSSDPSRFFSTDREIQRELSQLSDRISELEDRLEAEIISSTEAEVEAEVETEAEVEAESSSEAESESVTVAESDFSHLFGSPSLSSASEEDAPNDEKQEFQSYKSKFGKHYADAKEEEKRFQNWKINLQLIKQKANSAPLKLKASFVDNSGAISPEPIWGLTSLSDLSAEEMKKRKGYKPSNDTQEQLPLADPSDPEGLNPISSTNNLSTASFTTSHAHIRKPKTKLPPRFDWRDYPVITPMKDQGDCGDWYENNYITFNTFSTHTLRETVMRYIQSKRQDDNGSKGDTREGERIDEREYRIENIGYRIKDTGSTIGDLHRSSLISTIDYAEVLRFPYLLISSPSAFRVFVPFAISASIVAC